MLSFSEPAFYSVGSIVAHVAIDLHECYTGGYDVLWWRPWPGSPESGWSKSCTEPGPGDDVVAYSPGVSARRALAILAVFSTPLMVAWAQFGEGIPRPVHPYRLLLTVAAIIFMERGDILKQHLMDRELLPAEVVAAESWQCVFFFL